MSKSICGGELNDSLGDSYTICPGHHDLMGHWALPQKVLNDDY